MFYIPHKSGKHTQLLAQITLLCAYRKYNAPKAKQLGKQQLPTCSVRRQTHLITQLGTLLQPEIVLRNQYQEEEGRYKFIFDTRIVKDIFTCCIFRVCQQLLFPEEGCHGLGTEESFKYILYVLIVVFLQFSDLRGSG